MWPTKSSAGSGAHAPLRKTALRRVPRKCTDPDGARGPRRTAVGRSRLRALLFGACLALLAWFAPASAAVDDAPLVTLKSGRTYWVYGDLLVPVEVGPGIEGALTGNRWPQAILVYSFHASVSAAQQTDFRQWAAQWGNGAGVRFVENGSATNRVLVQRTSQIGCGSSVLGMVGGVQDLVIGTGANCWQPSVVLHELGHALGAIHEHQRSNRAAFVSITDHGIVANCGQGTWDANFKILATDTESAYDYASIMHYPSPAHYTCNGVGVSAEIQVLQRQPEGAPSGSQNVCTTAAACQAIIGSPAISARDRHAMALRYGYRIEVNVLGNGSGSILVDGSRESCGTRCYLVAPGTLLKVTPLPDSGSIASFSGGCIGFSCQFQPADNGSIQVRFTKKSSIAAVVSVLTQPRSDRIFSQDFDSTP